MRAFGVCFQVCTAAILPMLVVVSALDMISRASDQ